MYCAYPNTGSGNPLMYYYNGKTARAPSSVSEGLSPLHSSPNLPGSGSSSLLDGAANSAELWSSSNGMAPSGHGGMLGALSAAQSPSGNYGNMPSHERLSLCPRSVAMSEAGKSLPPMSTFHRTNASTPLLTLTAQRSQCFIASEGAGAGGSQTGEALGKALASIYSPETSSNFTSSSSTPVVSPSPLTTTTGTSQWPPVAVQTSLSSSYDTMLHSVMEDRLDRLDRLDDAIHVLRNHAVGSPSGSLTNDMRSPLPLPSRRPITAIPPHFPASQSSPVIGAARCEPANPSPLSSPGIPPTKDLTNRGKRLRGSDAVLLPATLPMGLGGQARVPLVLKVEATEGEDVAMHTHFTHTQRRSSCELGSDEDSDAREPKTPRRMTTGNSIHEEDEDLTPELKGERERGRRLANNARERLRVHDINEGFKELGHMCQLHLNSEKPQTKLLVLHQAVAVILSLEQQVRERNLNPKATCLRNREEERVTPLPLGPHSAHTALQSGLPNTLSNPNRPV
ncbi:transcription factor 12-like isoform X2 [Clupea harengus]|uniref:Transcription factor 12-like isoform X2 n=1 Tax=Clupea harengus TaxID=7950 RepID=A0A6P8FBM6_CLUHA|nr:transcription factor 12-like isoform X2 [Clupea harengus]